MHNDRGSYRVKLFNFFFGWAWWLLGKNWLQYLVKWVCQCSTSHNNIFKFEFILKFSFTKSFSELILWWSMHTLHLYSHSRCIECLHILFTKHPRPFLILVIKCYWAHIKGDIFVCFVISFSYCLSKHNVASRYYCKSNYFIPFGETTLLIFWPHFFKTGHFFA